MESEGEEELCGSRSARDGGCTFCVLPFGHAGAHDLGRAKRVSKPPALFVEEQYGFVAEAQGYTLHLSKHTLTGYQGVRRMNYGQFKAFGRLDDGSSKTLGTFNNAIDAAVAYARHVESSGALTGMAAVRALLRQAGLSGDVAARFEKEGYDDETYLMDLLVGDDDLLLPLLS